MKLRILSLAGLVVGFVGHALAADEAFTRITTGPGATPNGSSAAAWGDFNNDGWLDLFVTSFGGTQNNYCYTNNGDGTFTRVLPTFFPANNINSFGCAWADFDNDGYLDLVKGISNPFGGPTQLYRNNHNGTFANVTTVSIGNVGPGANNVVWGDYDNDGFVDLFLAVGYNAPDNVLLHNRGDGTFSRITGNPMVTATGISGGASWGDYDNDGRLDLIVTRTSAGCLFYHNEGGGAFRQITDQVISTDTNTAGVSWGDYDNDGLLDLFIAHMQSPNRLYRNNGEGNFTVLTNSVIYQMVGPSSGGAWADYDNDGWLDLFVANYRSTSFLFHNDGNGGFTSVTGVVTEIGTGQGAAWGDYDNDGFPDLLVPNIFTYNNFLYHNTGNTNAWLTLKLEGRRSNRAAIGAKVRVKATIRGRELWQLREISGGGSLGSQNDLRAGFGLGDATNVDVVRVEWPSGIVQELRDVTARQFLTVIEPDARVTPATLEVQAGEPAAFTLDTTLTPPIELQWKFNGLALPGETNATLFIAGVRSRDSGAYSVTLHQPATGLSFDTRPAQLTGPVVITQQPTNQNVRPGSNSTFRVIATGIRPIAYQWRFNGSSIAQATNSTLAIMNCQLADAGLYDVVITNSFGATTSMPAPLGILINPAITLQPLSQNAAVGRSVTLSIAVMGSPPPFTFEWRRGPLGLWTNITSERVSFFTLANLQTNQAGSYRVVVKNAANASPGIISSNAIVNVSPDIDGDGLPDGWETSNGFSSDDASDATLDADGDGMANAAEYQAGTDPRDAQSFLRIDSVACDGTNFWRIEFLAISNRTYTVEARGAFDSSDTPHRVTDIPAAPTNRNVEVTQPADAFPRQQFFRLLTPRQP